MKRHLYEALDDTVSVERIVQELSSHYDLFEKEDSVQSFVEQEKARSIEFVLQELKNLKQKDGDDSLIVEVENLLKSTFQSLARRPLVNHTEKKGPIFQISIKSFPSEKMKRSQRIFLSFSASNDRELDFFRKIKTDQDLRSLIPHIREELLKLENEDNFDRKDYENCYRLLFRLEELNAFKMVLKKLKTSSMKSVRLSFLIDKIEEHKRVVMGHLLEERDRVSHDISDDTEKMKLKKSFEQYGVEHISLLLKILKEERKRRENSTEPRVSYLEVEELFEKTMKQWDKEYAFFQRSLILLKTSDVRLKRETDDLNFKNQVKGLGLKMSNRAVSKYLGRNGEARDGILVEKMKKKEFEKISTVLEETLQRIFL